MTLEYIEIVHFLYLEILVKVSIYFFGWVLCALCELLSLNHISSKLRSIFFESFFLKVI